MFQHFRILIALAALYGAFLACRQSRAGETWDGGGANNNWTTAANWNTVRGESPPPNDGTADIVMAGSMRLTPRVDVDWDINSLTFNSTAGGFSISGDPGVSLGIGAGGITNNDTQLQILLLPIDLNASQTWNAAAGPLSIGNTVAGHPILPRTLTLDGANNFQLAGAITNGITLNKTGAGTLTFNGTNTNSYTGTTTVWAGTLALGRTGGANRAIPGNLVIGDGAGGAGADIVRLDTADQITEAAGRTVTLSSSGLFNLNGFNETLANLAINGGSISGAGSLIVNEALTFTGGGSITAATLSAPVSPVIVDNGVLNISSGGQLSNASGRIGSTSGSNGTVSVGGPGSTWTITGDLQIGASGAGMIKATNGGIVQAANINVAALGVIGGDGNLIGNLQNGGLVSPGTSPGALHLNGNYTQVPDGELLIELASVSAYDQVMITQDTLLGGMLTVNLLDGFIPTAGQSFTIITADDVDGTFTTEILPSVPGLMFDVVYNPQSVVIEVLAAGQRQQLRYTQISTEFNRPIGIDYFEPNNELLLTAHYPNGTPHNFERLTVEGIHVPHTSVSGITDEIRVATVVSPAFGGHPNTAFAPGTMFAHNGANGGILKVDPDGTVDLDWVHITNLPNVGLFRGSLHVDRTGVWDGDLIASTNAGYVFRINGAGVATQIGPQITGSTSQAIFTVPNDTETWGQMAGKVLVGAEEQSRLYWYDTSGNMGYWTVPAKIQDFDLIVPNENLFVVNYSDGRLLGVNAQQFLDQGLVGKILVTQEIPAAMYVLSWDFINNLPHFEPIAIAPDSPVSSITHFESATFNPAGVREIKTTLPTPRFSMSGDFGAVHDLAPSTIPSSVIAHYAYNGTTGTATPPEAHANAAVMAIVEDPTGLPSLLIVLDESGDASGGSLQLQLTANGPGLTSANTNLAVFDDLPSSGDSFTYSAGSGAFNWSWPAGQTDGAVIRLPIIRPLNDPLALWSITFDTLSFSGLDSFVFLADGQTIDLGNSGFNFTLALGELPLPGDYNGDGSVDAADYVVWRKNPDGFGGSAGYDTWRTNFGRTAAGSGATGSASAIEAIPEPATITLAVLLLLGLVAGRYRDD